MADEALSTKGARNSTSSPASLPGIRRSSTVGANGDNAQQSRSRPAHRLSTASSPGLNQDTGSPVELRRRSSNFSEYSISDARKQFRSSTDDLLLPRADTERLDAARVSHWHSAPLAFALLPALGGMLFTNGSSVVTDIMILGLAAIFLNWSVRIPWDWYHSAQEIRVREEYNGDTLVDDSDPTDDELISTSQVLDDVPEEDEDASPTLDTSKPTIRRLPAHESAANQLYLHELLALLSCFAFPLLGAWLLHTIRSSLSRPSEGLVSNYNLTIFLLASELRPMSHFLKLIQARTLHLQRIINSNPYNSVGGQPTKEVWDLKRRLDELESKGPSESVQSNGSGNIENQLSSKQITIVSTEARRTLQPELDSLNRAVRRYEKRLATQTMQTEGRILDLEARLADAITLAAAAAAQNSNRSQHGFASVLVEWAAFAVVFPLQLAALPFKAIASLMEFVKKIILGSSPSYPKKKSALNGRYATHSRMGAERMQSKGTKR